MRNVGVPARVATVPRPLHLLGLLAALALGGLFSGCSFSASVGGDSPTESLTEQIEAAYEDRTGIALRRLECEDIEAKEGAPIRCEGRNAKGVELLIEGRVTGAEGSAIDYHWDVARALVPGRTYAAAAVPVVERVAGTAVAGVRCERRVEVEVGALVRCEAKLESGAVVPVRLRLTDDDGGFEVLPPQ